MRKSLLLTGLGLLGGALSLAAFAADAPASKDWPTWRGAKRDAISTETGLLTEWTEAGPDVIWTAEDLGRGFSSLSIAGGKIYTMGERKGGCYLICLDMSGKELWAAPVGKGDPNCTPSIYGDRVYAMDRNGELACVGTESGNVIWTKSFTKDFGGKMMSGWGYSESPLVDGDWLIVTPGAKDAMLAALNKKTGDVIWKTAVPDLGSKGNDGAAYSSVVISNAGGVKQYVQLVGRGIVSSQAKDGKFLWSYNKVANGTADIPTPIIRDDYVFCSTGYGDGGSALLKVVKNGDKFSADEVWYKPAKELQNHHGGTILIGDYLYMGHGHNNGFPVCVEFLTGKDAWRPGRGPGGGSAAVVAADGHLYFRYQDGVMALIEATPKEYHLKGQFKIKTKHGESWPHPVVLDGKLYLRDQHNLHCYNVKKS